MPLRSLPSEVGRGGHKKAQALIRLTESFGKPLRPEPTCETAAEAKVRVSKTPLRGKANGGRGVARRYSGRVEHPYHIGVGFECQLMEARREVRFERGDF